MRRGYSGGATHASLGFDEHYIALGQAVVEQDTRACEINQQGLHCMRHERGVLVAQECEVYEFQQWVERALAEADRS
jgi:hypothetical protein